MSLNMGTATGMILVDKPNRNESPERHGQAKRKHQ